MIDITRKALALIGLLGLALAASAEADDHGDGDDRVVIYQYAVYLVPGSSGDPLDTARRLVGDRFDAYTIITDFAERPTSPVVAMTLVTDVADRYPPPDMQYLGYFGRGLSREQALSMQQSERVLVMDFAYPLGFQSSAFPAALYLTDEIARRHDGLIWDQVTREAFTAEAWREGRIDTWNAAAPPVRDHTVVHAYRNGEFVRAITLGMEKFGFPDIVVNSASWSTNTPMGNLIDLAAQTLVEKGDFDNGFSIAVDVESLANARIRDIIRASMVGDAEGRATLEFRPAEAEEGDPDNFLLELSFDAAPGSSIEQKQEALLGRVLGLQDTVALARHNQRILEASERAREKLPALRADFNRGLEPGESIMVKAPFETADGGTEWMWVEVEEWNDNVIEGMLQNEPLNIPGLRGGSHVIVDQRELFDYIRYHADGRIEGNETGQIIHGVQSH
jgi:uncharacterized protein YegJ (DUF2314 family)